MSRWSRVTTGVLHGSILAQVTLFIYINEMVEGVNSYASLFADDAEVTSSGGKKYI